MTEVTSACDGSQCRREPRIPKQLSLVFLNSGNGTSAAKSLWARWSSVSTDSGTIEDWMAFME